MNLGMSVLLFLVIGVVVMALFCFVTRYFNKKLQKALDDDNQVYSMIDDIRGNGNNQNGQENNGEDYDQFMNNKQNDTQGKVSNNPKDQKFELEMTEIKQPLRGYGNNNDIYGLGRLKKRLEGQESIQAKPQTGRSMTSLKSFKPERLDDQRKNSSTNRSNLPDQPSSTDRDNISIRSSTRKDKNQKNKNNVTIHKFISKIVCYDQNGLLLVENHVISICKGDTISEKRTIKNSNIKLQQSSFEDTLEAYGFQKGTFCAFKFQTTVQIPHMKPNQQYPVISLKSSEAKEQIQFVQFYSLKEKLEDA